VDDAKEQNAQVHALPDGDALALVPPQASDLSKTWLLQRISGESGNTSWTHPFSQLNNPRMTPVKWAVDEARGQVILTMSQQLMRSVEEEISSYDLRTGAEKWHSAHPLSFESVVPANPSLRSPDALTDFGHEFTLTRRHDWLRWHREGSLWLPNTGWISTERPLQKTVSAQDGSLLNRSCLGEENEQIAEVLTSPNQAHTALLLIEVAREYRPSAWRVLRLDHSGGQQISGSAFQADFPPPSIITDAGTIIMTGDPTPEQHWGWQVRAWR
jgi:hypothetical protein